MPQNQNLRDLVTKIKLRPNKAVINGQYDIFLDDFIVQETLLKNNVTNLHQAGIKEVNIYIIGSSLTYLCEYINVSNSRSSLDLVPIMP